MKPDVWLPAPERLEIRHGEVHVWRLLVEDVPAGFDPRAWLPGADLARIDRLRRPEDRRRAGLGWAALRDALGRYVDEDPASISIGRSCARCGHPSHGKPVLRSARWPGLDFNLSHAGSLVLWAVGMGVGVGIDVEPIRPVPDADQLAGLTLPAEDRAALARAPAHARDAVFLEAWTRMEAHVKLDGRGLPGLEAGAGPDPPRGVSFRLDPAPGHVAWMATDSPRWPSVRLWSWTLRRREPAQSP